MKNLLLIWLLIVSVVHSQSTTKDQQELMSYSAISVTIGGQFPVTGTFPAIMTDRVDQYVTRIYSNAFEKYNKTTNDPILLKQITDDLTNYSLRGIKLVRASGEELLIDLEKFRINGDFKNNPYLKNDDVLIFPTVDRERNFFSISGAVNQPGIFQFMDGDRLTDAIELSRGFNEAYKEIEEIRINRLSYDGKTSELIKVNPNEDIDLVRGDQITVYSPETQRKKFNVLVLGEALSPGIYPITKEGAKLGDVIKRAGGVTEIASLKSSRLYRGGKLTLFLEHIYGIKLKEKVDYIEPELADQLVQFEDLLMYRMSNLVVEDTAYFQIENRIRVLTEGSASNFTQINDSSSEIYNFELKSGDIIIIPQLKKAVYVFGQVANPGYVNLLPGADYKYYIDKVGGVGEYAEDEIMIIKGDSRNWVTAITSVSVEDGDYIFVPKQRLRSFRSTIVEWGGYFSIVGSIATVLLLIVQLTK